MLFCKRCKKTVEDTPFCPFCGHKQSTLKNKTKTRGNGTGTAYKRGNKWQAEINFISDGFRLKKTKGGFKTKKEALEYIPSLKGITPDYDTLYTLHKIWEENHCKNISHNRRKSYERHWMRLSAFHHRTINNVKYGELQEAINNITGYYARRDARTVFIGIWDIAIKDNPLLNNLPKMLKIGQLPKPQKNAFTEDNVKAMWDNLPQNPFFAYILIMIHTGMNFGELRNFERPTTKIDYNKRLIWGCGSKNNLRKTAPVLFPEKIIPLLQAYIPFDNKNDNTLFYNNYKAALKSIDIDYLPPGCCRHTTATLLTKKNIAPAVIQKIMRHTSYETTLGYTHLQLDDEQKAIDIL